MAYRFTRMTLCLLGLCWGAGALAALVPPTAAQAQAAAAKKVAADAQAAQDKLALSASMDTLSSRWRARAGQAGWKVYPAVAIAAVPTAAAMPGAAGAPAQPIKSEKLGNAAASGDVKKAPSMALPAGAPPTLDKGNGDKVKY